MAENYVATISDIVRFKGDTFSIPFQFTYDDGTPIDLNECTAVLLAVCPYGKYEDDAILTKKMKISESQINIASADFIEEDTKNFDATKVSFQPILIYDDTFEGSPRRRVFRRAEGDMLLKPDIKYDTAMV